LLFAAASVGAIVVAIVVALMDTAALTGSPERPQMPQAELERASHAAANARVDATAAEPAGTPRTDAAGAQRNDDGTQRNGDDATRTDAAGGPLPSVASINLCTDQLVLMLADDAQIRTVSWLAADPEESLLAERARQFPLNHGTAEEVLRFDPDVVIAGTLTSSFTRGLLERLGYRVVAIAPAESIDAIVAEVERVAAAIGQPARGARLADDLRRRRDAFARRAAPHRVGAVVLRPGGFTVGRGTLADELMTLAGLDNIAADRGLDRWGSLSVETLLRSEPEILIVARYRADQPSIANTVFEHPAVERLAARTASLAIQSPEWGCGLPQSLDSVAAMQRAAAAMEREAAAAKRGAVAKHGPATALPHDAPAALRHGAAARDFPSGISHQAAAAAPQHDPSTRDFLP
jgi:iron complex transport system substrate-binding protein